MGNRVKIKVPINSAKLKSLFTQNGYTVSEVAKLVNYNVTTISKGLHDSEMAIELVSLISRRMRIKISDFADLNGFFNGIYGLS